MYYPSDGQTLGCANICGSPLLAGSFEMVINISAIASAFGIEQVVTDSFPYQLTVEAGKAGTRRSPLRPLPGATRSSPVSKRPYRATPIKSTYNWDLGNGITSHGSGD